MDLYLKDVVFTTQQTDPDFILTSYLKGYGRRDIKIEINEDGSRMTIRGEQVEMVRGFQKTFKIPEGVVLDKIKARFDQDESRLSIRMPKSVKGLVTGIQLLEEIVGSTEHVQEKQVEKTEGENEAKPRCLIISSPVIAGSALFVSLIVVVFSLIRSKSESNQKRNY